MLKSKNSSPWDGRREYFLSMGYSRQDNTDSALVYAEKLFKMKPNHAKNVLIMCNMLEEKREYDKASEYIGTYLDNNKKNNNAWIFASQFHYRRDSLDKSWEVIEEGKKYLPKDTLVEKQHNFIYQRKFVQPFRDEYNKARQFFDRKDYRSALVHLNTYLENVPDDFLAHRLRVYIYYYLKEYQKGLEEANHALTLREDNGVVLNMRGVLYRQLNDMDSACKDWKAAMDKGNADGRTNYDRFCK